MKFTDELTLLLKARYPIIYINTIEEDRVVQGLTAGDAVCLEYLFVKQEWSKING